VISIGYAQKNDMLLGEMGLSEFCQHIERLNPSCWSSNLPGLSGARRNIRAWFGKAQRNCAPG
jgi:polysaccharide pyruvyl transferase WcaK-like protein